jgi:hypothetical protein
MATDPPVVKPWAPGVIVNGLAVVTFALGLFLAAVPGFLGCADESWLASVFLLEPLLIVTQWSERSSHLYV